MNGQVCKISLGRHGSVCRNYFLLHLRMRKIKLKKPLQSLSLSWSLQFVNKSWPGRIPNLEQRYRDITYVLSCRHSGVVLLQIAGCAIGDPFRGHDVRVEREDEGWPDDVTALYLAFLPQRMLEGS